MDSTHFIKNIRFYFERIDAILFFTVMILLAVSILNMYGITGFDSPIFRKQIILTIIGLAVMVLFSFFNYRYLKNYSLPVLFLYVISLILLGLTFFSGSVRGTNSWLSLSSLTLEPVELTKLCLIILMAKYFSQRHIHINQFRHIIISGAYFLIPAVIIVKQPDLGSAVILSLIWASLLIGAGINRKNIFILLGITLIIGFMSWTFMLKPYQKTRIVSFLDQGSDPLGSGYNLNQSKIAIGSGFWLGNGLGKGSQASLGFLPEPHNDFIFAALAEQFGLVGVVFILVLISVGLYRILTIGSGTPSNFGKLFSIGLSVFIFSHVFISTGVNIGLLPVTGLPFPFLSSGGSNLVSIMTGLGILQSIKRYG